jgi:hypothetical protein
VRDHRVDLEHPLVRRIVGPPFGDGADERRKRLGGNGRQIGHPVVKVLERSQVEVERGVLGDESSEGGLVDVVGGREREQNGDVRRDAERRR